MAMKMIIQWPTLKQMILIVLISLLCHAQASGAATIRVEPSSGPGDLDLTFGNMGMVVAPTQGEGHALALQGDGKILVAGTSQGDFAIVVAGSSDDHFALARYTNYRFVFLPLILK
jgi:hypothetical protein